MFTWKITHLGKIGTNWSFLAITPNILSVGNTALQSSRIGMLEVLEENIGVGDVVNWACCVGRGGHIIISYKPLFEIEKWKDYPAVSVAKMGQMGQGDGLPNPRSTVENISIGWFCQVRRLDTFHHLNSWLPDHDGSVLQFSTSVNPVSWTKIVGCIVALLRSKLFAEELW